MHTYLDKNFTNVFSAVSWLNGTNMPQFIQQIGKPSQGNTGERKKD